jgi:hypothetical protein
MILYTSDEFDKGYNSNLQIRKLFYNNNIIYGEKNSYVKLTFNDNSQRTDFYDDEIVPNNIYSGNTAITSVEMNGISEISTMAFYKCKNLSAATLNEGLQKIGSSAFNNCSGLTSINLPISLSNIGENAFEWCFGLISIEIPSSVKTLSAQVFLGCKNLTNITFNEGLERIEGAAFFQCWKLTNVTIPDSVTYFGRNAFEECSRLAVIDFGNTRSTIPTLGGSGSVFYGLPNNYVIVVPNALVNSWKTTSGWSSVASHIVSYTNYHNN